MHKMFDGVGGSARPVLIPRSLTPRWERNLPLNRRQSLSLGVVMQSGTSALAVALSVLLLGACRDASTPLHPGPQQLLAPQLPIASGPYIVVFKDAVAEPDALARTLVSALGGTLRHTYASALKGFAARLSDAAVATLRQHPLVAYVEPDQVVRMDGTQQMDANGEPWGLDRIDQRTLSLDHTYTYSSTGAGVHVYLIDTGIWTAHAEFGGRADIVFDAYGLDGADCSGHGTAVAGIVGAATYGVAKGVFLHGVRVYFDCGGIGFASDVISGVDWVTANHASPAVANMSVSLDPSTALNTAVANLWNSGVFVVATAANHNVDACLEAGGASRAFTVAASTRADAKADFSNWGPCVDVYAPGQDIKSTWLGSLTMTQSGTSFAAPHVTGVAALYKAIFGDAPSDTVANWIVTNATAGVITGNPSGTPNLLVYSPGSFAGPETNGEVIGHFQIGVGSPEPYNNVQSFDFEVRSDLTGTFKGTDWNDLRPDGTPASMTVNASSDPQTRITAYRHSSSACLDPTRGVEIDGIGREDVGALVAFTAAACDNGPAGSGLDFFSFVIPEEGYRRSGPVTAGDIVKR